MVALGKERLIVFLLITVILGKALIFYDISRLIYAPLLLLISIWLSHNLRFSCRLLFAISALSASFLFSTILMGYDSRFSPLTRFISLLMVIIAAYQFKVSGRANEITTSMRIVIFICCALSLAGFLLGYDMYETNNVAYPEFIGLFKHSLFLGQFACFGYVLFNGLNLKYDLLLFLLFMSCAILSASKFAIAFTLIVFLFRHKWFSAVVISFLPFLLPLILEIDILAIKKLQFILDKGNIAYTRQNLWLDRLAEWRSSPVFGIGPFNTYTHNLSENTLGTVEPGSTFLAFLSMFGFVGFIPWMALVIRKITLPRLFFYSLCLIEGIGLSSGHPLCFLFYLTIFTDEIG